MKMIQLLALGGSLMLATSLPSFASKSYNESSNNWDSQAWDRGGYFEDYYPTAKTCEAKKHHHNY